MTRGNPLAVKKIHRFLDPHPAPIATTISEPIDCRGMENMKVVLQVTDASGTGEVYAAIYGRNKKTDGWGVLFFSGILQGNAVEVFPAPADAPGYTFPRYVYVLLGVQDLAVDAVLFTMEHTQPHEGRQINHHSRD
jgi:hypothetical protein